MSHRAENENALELTDSVAMGQTERRDALPGISIHLTLSLLLPTDPTNNNSTAET